MGYLVLQGGREFSGQMEASDQRAMELAGGPHAGIGIIPAAAAPDRNHVRAGQNGVSWFRHLGAQNIDVVPLIDKASASDPAVSAQLRRLNLIYLLGGFPVYLAECLAGSPAWEAISAALGDGAVLAGSSAGAMVLCHHLFDPRHKLVVQGLGLIEDACLIPHHNRNGSQWAAVLRKDLPRAVLIGIDEETGMISDGHKPPCSWTVYGRGAVTLYIGRDVQIATHGTSFDL